MPVGDTARFELAVTESITPLVHYGERDRVPDLIWTHLANNKLLIHPDVVQGLGPCTTSERSGIWVAPQASARTVVVESEGMGCLKLHHDGVIGRMERRLGSLQAKHAVWISEQISKAILQRRLPERFYHLEEPYGCVGNVALAQGQKEIGLMYRPSSTNGIGPKPHTLIPAFALFAKDLKAENDALLVHQLCDASGEDTRSFLKWRLLVPALDAYFSLLRQLGLQAEAHAQNILYAVSAEGKILGVALRDMESVSIDLGIIDHFKLDVPPAPESSKVLRPSMPDYQKRHSLMFDFKLGTYLLEPLIEAFFEEGSSDWADAVGEAQCVTDSYLSTFPLDYLPTDRWWAHAKVAIDRRTNERPYVAYPKPLFRSVGRIGTNRPPKFDL